MNLAPLAETMPWADVTFDLLLAICSATPFGRMIVMLLLLPEAHGRSLATLETAAAGHRSLSHAYFTELTISATADLALSFLSVVAATFREWRRPTG